MSTVTQKHNYYVDTVNGLKVQACTRNTYISQHSLSIAFSRHVVLPMPDEKQMTSCCWLDLL